MKRKEARPSKHNLKSERKNLAQEMHMKCTNRHFLLRECVVHGIPHVIIILRSDWLIIFVDATACFTAPYPSSEDKGYLHFNDFDNENFVSFMQKFTDLVV